MEEPTDIHACARARVCVCRRQISLVNSTRFYPICPITLLLFCVVPIRAWKRNAMYWRWFITMARCSGSRCRSLNPPVRLTFGRRLSNDLLSSQSCSRPFSRRFPYDRQNCSMKFGTWTYDSSKVNLKFYRDIQKFDLHSYVKSNEWSIIGNSASRNTEKYGRAFSERDGSSCSLRRH